MEIKKICVLGAGLMGNGIAQVCAAAGFDVRRRCFGNWFVPAIWDANPVAAFMTTARNNVTKN